MNILYKISNLEIFKGRFTFLCLLKNRILLGLFRGDKRLQSLYNKYSGKRCFIVALGPSLSLEDLNLLAKHKEYTFSMNKCYQMFDKSDWRPNCYFISDRRVFTSQTKSKIFKMSENGIDIIYSKFAILTGMPKKAIYYRTNYTDSILSSSRKEKYKKKAQNLKFSTNAFQYVYDGHTCVQSLIQIAYYLGFKEIYLLGCDCGVTTNKTYTDLINYVECDAKKQNEIGDLLIKDYMALESDRKLKNLDVRIYNASKGGRLEVFPRIPLSDLFPDTKEN